MPRFAAIDVGSNALRLRVIEAGAPSQASRGDGAAAAAPAESAWKDLATVRAPVRLGSEVFVSGRLAPASIGQACDALREFRQEMDRWKVDDYRAIATSAVREAKNGATLMERARREAGIELEAIEGIEEARLIQLAVTRRIPVGDKRALLVDVGGGSTEITLLNRGQPDFTRSLALGTVRILEAYLKGVKTVDRARERLLEEVIDRALGEALPEVGSVEVLVGTGGNVDTLCELCPAKGPVRAIDVAAARATFKKMCAMSNGERRDAYQLRPDRADTIVPATAIFLRLAQVLKMQLILAPGVGLAAGILEELVDKFFHVWDAAGEAERVLEVCARLGKRYHFDEAHARQVCRFSTQLFDDLQRVHAFVERDRLLLRAAAMLHDIGDYVHYSGHHKHSQYLIQHADIMGLSPDERAIVSNIARYHRKGPPDPSHPAYRDLSKEARGKVRGLSAILRIADALDREHKQKIESVRAAIDRGAGHVTLFLRGGDGDRELEEWTVGAKASLWRDEYDLDIVVAKAEVGGVKGLAVRAGMAALLAGAGCATSSVPDPRDAARAYASAAQRGDAQAIYAMLSTPAREARSKAELLALLEDERAELAEQGKDISSPDARVEATARLRFADGEEAALDLRSGRYEVTAAGALPGGARTPEGALEQLRRVLARRSYAGLMRVLSQPTRAAMENDLRTLVDGLIDPPGLPIQLGGDTAVVQVPGGHQVKLRRESGVWRVEDFD